MSQEKDWIDITAALLTPVIAILGIVIATFQWRLNKARFRHEMFEKRYAIFEATQLFMSQIVSEAKYTNDQRIEFLRKTKVAFAVYNKDILDYLDKVHRKALELNLHQQKGQHEEEAEVCSWFGEQIQNIDKVFKDQLKVG
jgi:hypothetical protein